jgi:hypothetical protein
MVCLRSIVVLLCCILGKMVWCQGLTWNVDLMVACSVVIVESLIWALAVGGLEVKIEDLSGCDTVDC